MVAALAFTPRLLTKVHMSSVAALPVGRTCRLSAVELHAAKPLAVIGSPASVSSTVLIAPAATATAAASKVAVVVWSAEAPLMEPDDQSPTGGRLPKPLV